MGNICRSPVAAAMFRDLVAQRGLAQKIEVDSAGTYGFHIEVMDASPKCGDAVPNRALNTHRHPNCHRSATEADVAHSHLRMGHERKP